MNSQASEIPLLGKGGVPRSGGVVRSGNQLLDQHHPGAHQEIGHPPLL